MVSRAMEPDCGGTERTGVGLQDTRCQGTALKASFSIVQFTLSMSSLDVLSFLCLYSIIIVFLCMWREKRTNQALPFALELNQPWQEMHKRYLGREK